VKLHNILTRNSLKYFFNFIAVIIVIFSLVSLNIFQETKQELLALSTQSDIDHTRDIIRNISRVIQKKVDKDFYNTLEKDPKLVKELESFLSSFITKKYQYIYLIGKKSADSEHYYFLADGSRKDKSDFGEIYTPFNQEEWQMLYKEKRGRYFEHSALEGLWITYLQPIIHQGNIEAVLVIDFSVAERQKIENALSSLTELSHNAFILFSFLFLFVLILSYIDAKREKEKELAYEKLQHLNDKLEIDIHNAVQEMRNKEKLLQQQSRLAQMGEMINMIAHQWRQPLNSISSAAITIQLKIKSVHNGISDESKREKLLAVIQKKASNIEAYSQILSSTIDDFRNFFKQDKQKKIVSIIDPIERTLFIVESALKSHSVTLVKEYHTEDEVSIYPNEIMQVMLNIIKNAQDNFQEKGIKDPLISITTTQENGELVITICDNGGGIDERIIDKIFEPYFSTKEEKNGTGLGLYMSKMMVEEHNNGSLFVENRDDGACFVIKLKKG